MTGRAQDVDERLIEKEVSLVLDMQFLIQDIMNKTGISRAELASRMGISRARLTQLMKAEANPTLHTLVGIFHALGSSLEVQKQDEAVVLAAAPDPNWIELKSPGRLVVTAPNASRQLHMMDTLRQRSGRFAANDDAVAYSSDITILVA